MTDKTNHEEIQKFFLSFLNRVKHLNRQQQECDALYEWLTKHNDIMSHLVVVMLGVDYSGEKLDRRSTASVLLPVVFIENEMQLEGLSCIYCEAVRRLLVNPNDRVAMNIQMFFSLVQINYNLEEMQFLDWLDDKLNNKDSAVFNNNMERTNALYHEIISAETNQKSEILPKKQHKKQAKQAGHKPITQEILLLSICLFTGIVYTLTVVLAATNTFSPLSGPIEFLAEKIGESAALAITNNIILSAFAQGMLALVLVGAPSTLYLLGRYLYNFFSGGNRNTIKAHDKKKPNNTENIEGNHAHVETTLPFRLFRLSQRYSYALKKRSPKHEEPHEDKIKPNPDLPK